MSLLSLFAVVAFAAESIISPIPNDVLGTPGQFAQNPQPAVSFSQLPNPTPTPTATPIPTAIPAPTPKVLGVTTDAPAPVAPTNKKAYTIAVLGDSMVDTLGPGVPHLKSRLTSTFGANFTLLNYGVGGTNIDYGLQRVTSDYEYLGSHIPSLVSQHPDLVVVESFGYNPYSYDTGAIDKHWLQLAAIVDTLRANLPGVKIVIAATIAPNSKTFGDGAAGLSFSQDDKWKRTDNIKHYLESTVKFAKSQGLPLADAYHSSLDGNADGILSYINPGDHIHPSDAGKALFASKVTNAIAANHLLN